MVKELISCYGIIEKNGHNCRGQDNDYCYGRTQADSREEAAEGVVKGSCEKKYTRYDKPYTCGTKAKNIYNNIIVY